MTETRRIPGLGAILAVAFLLAPIAVVAWWLNRAKSDAPTTNLADLDVVCLGRVDGLSPVVALEPNVPGKVVAVVAEGQEVAAGKELLKIDDEAMTLRVEEAREALAAAEIDVQVAQMDQQFHPRRKALQQAAVTTATARAAAARNLYQERAAAKPFGTVTPAELQAAEAEARQLEHLVETEKARLEELDGHDGTLRIKAAEAKRAMAQTSLKQAEKAVRDCVLRAPGPGLVLRVQTAVGETVAPGGNQPALLFRPDGPLVVRAELEQEYLGRVKAGMKATIQDDVRADSPTWTGTVQRVGTWVARKRSVLLDPGEVNDVRTVECLIAFDGKPDALLIGQRMRVRIAKQ